MKGRLAISVLALAMAAALIPAPASAETLDQQQTDHSNGSVFPGGPASAFGAASFAETFTAGLSGALDRVDLYLIASGNTGPLTVQIRNVTGTAPGTTVLATTNVPQSSVAATGAWTPVAFSTAPAVQAGTHYAIVAYAGGSDSYGWSVSAGKSYGGGATFGSFASPPGVWGSPYTSYDVAFKTYVTAPSTTPPPGAGGATGERAAALAKCKKKHSKRARRKCRKKANLLPV